MRSLISRLAAIILFAAPAWADPPLVGVAPIVTGNYVDGSVTLSTSAQNVLAAPSSGVTRYRIKVINTDFSTAGGGSGIVVWCRWKTVVAGAAAVHGVGSFPVFPGGGIDDQAVGVNQNAMNCIAESGAPILYVEVY